MSRGAPLRSTFYLREAGDSYFQWLADDVSLHNDAEYWRLLRALHRKEFYAANRKDVQIGEDGLYLRYMYKRNYRDYEDNNPILPSCLEVLLGLSMRLEVALLKVSANDWFWIFLTNLGLDKFTDDDYDKCGGTNMVNYILSQWLMRNYHSDGSRYCIFPIRNASYEYSRTDMVTQAYMYIRENYKTDWTILEDPRYFDM